MTVSPLAYADSLRIGTIDFVSPDQLKVLLELDAPDVLALNTGVPQPFPRINGYVLVPIDGGYLVGQVEWITIERSPYPKRRGLQDFGLIDLPYPLRKLSIAPLGMLRTEPSEDDTGFWFRRGVDAYPSVGQPVLLPTTEQLRSIVESGEKRHVWIGNSPLAAEASVRVDPDRLFGRHLAVLGNTGSGKSCSVAGLIRWSLEAADQRRTNHGADSVTQGPNARFVVLDPNGEYAGSFDDLAGRVDVKRFAVEPSGQASQLVVPIWLWNTDEWCAFTQAAPRAQRPTLIQALRAVRDGASAPVASESTAMRRFLRTLVTISRLELASGSPWGKFPQPKSFFNKLETWLPGIDDALECTEAQEAALGDVIAHIEKLLDGRAGPYPTWEFTREEVTVLVRLLSVAHAAFGGTESDTLPIDPDTPRPFEADDLLRSIEAHAELLGVVDYVETMLMRVRTLLSDARMSPVINPAGGATLADWLAEYIGDDSGARASITVIDLSLVPAEVVHVLTAVIARMILEAQQRYRRLNGGKVLPTVLVMEEAHTFVKRYQESAENPQTGSVCCQVFERIAREGRKFGLGLVLSSQRPSELSATVLSQCNTFLLHRITNDRDQELVHRLVPDNLRGLLRDLPSLPARQAILLGWASELPSLVEMRHLPEDHRPMSADPDFWDVWTRAKERKADWPTLASDWQNLPGGGDPE